MPIPANVAIRFNKPDKAALIKVAFLMKKSQSELLRILVREKLAALEKHQLNTDVPLTLNPHYRRSKHDHKRGK